MEFGMAVKQIFRGLRGFGVDERNPRLAPPFLLTCTLAIDRVDSN